MLRQRWRATLTHRSCRGVQAGNERKSRAGGASGGTAEITGGKDTEDETELGK